MFLPELPEGLGLEGYIILAGTLILLLQLVVSPLLKILGFGKIGIVAGKCILISSITSAICHDTLNCTELTSSLTHYPFFLRIHCSQGSVPFADRSLRKHFCHFTECRNGRIWSKSDCRRIDGCWTFDCVCWCCACRLVEVEDWIMMGFTGFLALCPCWMIASNNL